LFWPDRAWQIVAQPRSIPDERLILAQIPLVSSAWHPRNYARRYTGCAPPHHTRVLDNGLACSCVGICDRDIILDLATHHLHIVHERTTGPQVRVKLAAQIDPEDVPTLHQHRKVPLHGTIERALGWA